MNTMYNFQYLIFLFVKSCSARKSSAVIFVVTSFSVLVSFGEFTKYYSIQYLMIFSSGKLFRINKSLPTSVCNQGHQAMKGIEPYSYD